MRMERCFEVVMRTREILDKGGYSRNLVISN